MNKVEKVVVDIARDAAWPVTHAAKVVALLGTALKDEPALKSAVTGLVQAAAKVIADGALDVAAKGLSLPEDMSTVADMISFFKYFTATFLPEASAVVKDIDVDLKIPAAA